MMLSAVERYGLKPDSRGLPGPHWKKKKCVGRIEWNGNTLQNSISIKAVVA